MNKYFRQFILLIIVIIAASLTVSAQEKASELPGAMFTEILTDARSAGMGGVTNLLHPSASAVFSNPSANLFSKEKLGVGTTLSTLNKSGKNNLFSLGSFYNVDDKQGVALGFRYYNYPSINLLNASGENDGKFAPSEMTLDLAYGYKLTEDFALSVTARYINSNMGSFMDASPASAFAADVGFTYKSQLNSMDDGSVSLGVAITNIGTKLKYHNDIDALPLPASIKAGGAVEIPFNEDHRLTAAINAGYRISPSHFGGYELGAGAEYSMFRHFSLRAGYHLSDAAKGMGNFATLGAGINFKPIKLDISYWAGVPDQDFKNILFISLSACF